MEWDIKFEVGHDKIDLEHRVFFNLVQSVQGAEKDGVSRDKLRRLIAETVKYAEFHFLSEENIMIDIGYPSFEDHRHHHKELMNELNSYIIKFESGKAEAYELVEFLNSWFANHTTREDLWLSKYVKKKK